VFCAQCVRCLVEEFELYRIGGGFISSLQTGPLVYKLWIGRMIVPFFRARGDRRQPAVCSIFKKRIFLKKCKKILIRLLKTSSLQALEVYCNGAILIRLIKNLLLIDFIRINNGLCFFLLKKFFHKTKGAQQVATFVRDKNDFTILLRH